MHKKPEKNLAINNVSLFIIQSDVAIYYGYKMLAVLI